MTNPPPAGIAGMNCHRTDDGLMRRWAEGAAGANEGSGVEAFNRQHAPGEPTPGAQFTMQDDQGAGIQRRA